MKKELLLIFCILISIVSDAKKLNQSTWNTPNVLFNNSDCVKVEKVKFGSERTEVFIETHIGASCNTKSSYLSDDMQNVYKCLGVDTIGYTKGNKNVRMALLYESCSRGVVTLDIKNLFANQQIRIEGIMKGKPSFSQVNTTNISIPEEVLTADVSVVKGHIDGWDPYRGYGFLYAYNDYDANGPDTYYSRIGDEGDFELKIHNPKVKLLYLEMSFLGNSCRVPVIAVPGDTLVVTMHKDNIGNYSAMYDFKGCRSNFVSENFLYLLHDYPIYSPHVMLKYMSSEDYGNKIMEYHDKELVIADYYKQKYNLSDREVFMLKRSADINFLTNLLYLNDLTNPASSRAFAIDEQIENECMEIINNDLCTSLPGYNRLKYIVGNKWKELKDTSDDFTKKHLEDTMQKESVFDKISVMKDSLASSLYYQFIFVDTTKNCIDMLSKIDNLIYDFHESKKLRLVFVICDELYKCKEVNLITNHFLQNQIVINLSLNDYYTLNECLGNTLNSTVSKTIDSEGFVLNKSLPLNDETRFRRELRKKVNSMGQGHTH